MGIGRFKGLNLIMSKRYRGIFSKIEQYERKTVLVYILGPKLTITPHPPQNPQNMIQQSSNHDFEMLNSGNINYNETWTWPSMQRAFFFLLASLFFER